MTTLASPRGLGDVSAAWLSAAIGGRFGGAVTIRRITPIGTGQIADTARVALDWDPAGAGPNTVVAKVASSSPDVLVTISVLTSVVEVGFYTDLAPTVRVHVPACYWAGYDREANGCGLVLEDVAPAVQGDQMRGLTADETDRALDELVGLHAPRWGDPALSELQWLRSTATRPDAMATLLKRELPGFLIRFADRFDDDVASLVERFVAVSESFFAAARDAETAVHGDFRCDNLLFGRERVVVVDWQSVMLGDGFYDVSYLLGCSLTTELRRAHERELVHSYCERIAAFGVALDDGDAWSRYRLNAFAGIVVSLAASGFAARTERGDEMFVTMTNRAAWQAIDLESEALL